MLAASNIVYDVADRALALGAGGIGAIHLMARNIGLSQLIDQYIHVLKFHLPYHESDDRAGTIGLQHPGRQDLS